MKSTALRKSLSVALIAAVAMAVPVAAGQEQGQSRIIQRVVVKVNGEALTQTELEERQIEALKERNPQLESANLQDDALRAQLAELTPRVLTEAVDELLLIQRGRELGYSMSDEQFTRFTDNFKKENQMDDQRLQAELKAAGMTIASWRAMLERSVIIQTVQSREIMSKATLTESEMKAYYEAHPAEFMTPATVTLREVFVSVPTESRGGQTVFNAGGEEAAKAKIEAARDRLVKGEDAAAVVGEISESGSKANGGLVGPVNLNEIDPALRPALENLKEGEVTQPIRTSRGYLIFKMDARTASVPRPFTEVRDDVYQRIMGQRVDGETKKYLDTIRGAALIEWKDEQMRKLYEQGLAQKSSGNRP